MFCTQGDVIQYMRHTTFNFNRTKTKIDTYPDTMKAQYSIYMGWI